TAALAVNDGQWHHVAAVLQDDGSPTLDEIKLYIGGVLQNTTYTSAAAIDTGSSQDVMVGAVENAAVPSVFFNGSIDDVMVFDTALSQQEIEALVNP
ncbi:MAG: LamG domain-containing protein, partial [Planctomycetales bacterium]|nr:LamG domain-containing protein [Planctomycetales bacterium]